MDQQPHSIANQDDQTKSVRSLSFSILSYLICQKVKAARREGRQSLHSMPCSKGISLFLSLSFLISSLLCLQMKCVGAEDGNQPCQRCQRTNAECDHLLFSSIIPSSAHINHFRRCIFEKHRRGRKPGSKSVSLTLSPHIPSFPPFSDRQPKGCLRLQRCSVASKRA